MVDRIGAVGPQQAREATPNDETERRDRVQREDAVRPQEARAVKGVVDVPPPRDGGPIDRVQLSDAARDSVVRVADVTEDREAAPTPNAEATAPDAPPTGASDADTRNANRLAEAKAQTEARADEARASDEAERRAAELADQLKARGDEAGRLHKPEEVPQAGALLS